MIGNVIVGQSGGPTAVINSSLAGVYKTSKERGANKVYGMLHGIQGFIEGKYVDLSEHITSELDIELLKRTPSSYLGSCRYKLPNSSDDDEIYKNIFAKLTSLDIKYFFYIGGNDSMDTINKLYKYGKIINSDIVFIGVPKTIDNDLDQTDHTPGFGSAGKYLASITKEIIRDGIVYDINQITILEVMGRNAGWLTASTALSRGEDSDGPDLIYLPEYSFNTDDFLEKVNALQKHKKSIVVAVSEGIKSADGKYICENYSSINYVDNFGHKSLTGTARYLSELASIKLGGKTRAIEFSTLQRCASHIVSRVDITEAFQVGGAAVKLACENFNGKMVTLERTSDEPYQCKTGMINIDEVANIEKKIPMNWIDIKNNYVKKEFLTYARPLVQAELTPIMVNGLPQHLYYKKNTL